MKHTRNSTQATLLPKETGNKLIDTMKEEKKKRWEEVITSIDLTHNSRKAWQTIKKISNDPTSPNLPCLVKSNQVAHYLIVNGKGTMPTKPKCPALLTVEGKPSLVSAFSEEEYRKGIAALKNNKAAGIDDILVEQLKKAPNDAAYKRWSCHSGFKLLCKLCRTSPPPAMGARFTVFLGMPAMRTRWMAGAAAHKSG